MTVKWQGDALLARVRQGAQRGLVAATEDLRNEAVRLITQTSKTGQIYTRRSVTHQASAPGEPPASDTGHLVNSIRTEYDLSNLTGRVVVGAHYGAHLEFGTRKMAARPYLRPTLANRRAHIEQLVSRAIQAALKG